MKPRFYRGIVAASAFLMSLSLALAQPKPTPDVYLVTIDTLRADHVHCYGYQNISTPALDSLAQDGIRFTQAFTPSPLTNTSHTSILTGLLPSVHGVTDFGIPLASSVNTWAELLKQNGYQTAAFIGSIVLDAHSVAPGLDRGFDSYDYFPQNAPTGSRWGRLERRGGDVVRRAQMWMEAHPDKPRFVWVHLYDPHDPYDPPLPFSKEYKGHLYDGEIAYADSALGRLLTYLKQTNRYQHAVIIVVGDHGEGLGEHGEQTHGIFLYDATTHVPLLLKLPANSSAGTVIPAQVQTTDILPTTLDLLHIAPPAPLANRSLSPYFTHTEKDDRIVFGETDYPLRFGWAPLRAARGKEAQFIEAPQPELYDLAKDPGERTNNYEPWNKSVQFLRAQIASSGMRPPTVSLATGNAGSKTLNELRALGYLGPKDALTTTNVPELSSLPDPKDKIEEQNLLHTAMMFTDQGQTQDARTSLEKLLKLDPNFPVALRQLGELAFNTKDYATAADCFHRLLAAHPEDNAAALFEAKTLDKIGNQKAARVLLEDVVTRVPGQIEGRLFLARLDDQLSDRASEQDQLEAVLLLEPSNHDALTGLAQLQLRARLFSDVIGLLEPQVEKGSASPDMVSLLAQAYSGAGRQADANQLRRQQH